MPEQRTGTRFIASFPGTSLSPASEFEQPAVDFIFASPQTKVSRVALAIWEGALTRPHRLRWIEARPAAPRARPPPAAHIDEMENRGLFCTLCYLMFNAPLLFIVTGE